MPCACGRAAGERRFRSRAARLSCGFNSCVRAFLLLSPVAKSKMSDECGELLSLNRKGAASGRGFLCDRGVVLGAPIDHRDSCVDLRQGSGLFPRGVDDRNHVLADFLDIGDDVREDRSGLADQIYALLNFLIRCVDQCRDLLGCLCRTLGKPANFLGHDRKSSSCVSGTCGLHTPALRARRLV